MPSYRKRTFLKKAENNAHLRIIFGCNTNLKLKFHMLRNISPVFYLHDIYIRVHF